MRKIIKVLIVFASLMCFNEALQAQRQMENLDRGLVAVKVSNGVFVSWRLQGYEWYDVTYNVYRDGGKINSEPLLVSNYQDASGTLTSQYSVTAIVDGVEQSASAAVQPLAQQYLEIPMVTRPAGYEINDATAADLDGDGEYEIIVKRVKNDWTVAATQFSYFEAYKMDGTLMWEINVGPNIMSSSAVEINIAAFDLDEDGKAEVFMRTSEGTIFGDGTEIGDTDGDNKTNYRYSVVQSGNMEYMQEGPEFLSLIDGQTGAELDRVDFIPRINSAWWWGGNTKAYGHRANKFFFGAPYLDGKRPSLFIGRGIYTQTKMVTYDVVDKKLIKRWDFFSGNSGPYFGQGNHNYTIADVDMDGRDEIVWGSMTVDDDGTGLYSTEFGHGDALHVGDLDPFRKGTEIWKCLEESPAFGTTLYDGATGEILIHDVLGRDCGRACAANISDNIKGKALWGGTAVFSASTKVPVTTETGAVNYRIYWDGDLLEEVLDHNWNGSGGEGSIRKVDNSGKANQIFVASGTNSCNWTKGTPSLQADLFGDWREEVVWRTSDDSKIRIYTTTDPTPYRNYSLMHDHQYRQAICWQMCGYNQPPHVSYFLGEGEGLTVPPPPSITNKRSVYDGSGTWDKTSSVWLKDGVSSVYSDGEHVHFDVLKGDDVAVSLAEAVSPSVLTVASPGDYTINVSGSGKLTGDMKLVKQGIGSLALNGDHDYSGITEVWTGRLSYSGIMSNSPVWLGMFGEMEATGEVRKGAIMRYGSKLYVGGDNTSGTLTVVDSLMLEESAEIVIDLFAPASGSNDVLTITGDLIFANKSVLRVIPHLAEGETKLEPGDYTIATVSGTITGNVDKINIDGILGTAASLEIRGSEIVMVVKAMRDAGAVIWNGATTNRWDLANSLNFLNNSVEDVFVTGDDVTFNDDAVNKTVQVLEQVSPSSLTIDATTNYSFIGAGSISGDASFTKSGSGKVTIINDNDFTGKVTINEGTVEVLKMPTSIGNSPLGVPSQNTSNFVINGGVLSVLSECVADRAISLGSNGGTIKNKHNLTMNDQISGGVLTKAGVGNLILAGANTNSSLIIQEGQVSLLDAASRPGRSVTLKNGIFQYYNSGGTNYTWPIVIPEGNSGTLRLDGRCAVSSSLTGGGDLHIFTHFIRSDLIGDWSAFTGAISTSTDSDGGWLILGSSKGYAKASVDLCDNVTLLHNYSTNATIEIGQLTGTSKSILGSGGQGANKITWKIGGMNTSFTFNGVINNNQYKYSGSSAAIIKTGSGQMILTNANTYTGGTIVEEGVLMINNSSGSGTGSGSVVVKNGASLGGNGVASSSVSVQNGGMLRAGYTNVGSSLTVRSATLSSGAVFRVGTNPAYGTSDKLKVTSTFRANGQLVMYRGNTRPFKAGQSYKIVECNSISGSFASISPEIPGEGMEWDISEFTETGTIHVVEVTGLKNHSIVESLSLYPNPTDGVVNVNIPEGLGSAIVQVETLNGNILSQQSYSEISQLKLDLSQYEKGLYIVRVLFDERVLMGKVVLK